MKRLVAIDPGDEHVGVASFYDLNPPHCHWAGELNPEQFVDFFEAGLRRRPPDLVVYEEFRLYPWAAQQQTWSEMLTPQLIGVIRHLCRRYDVPAIKQPAKLMAPTHGVLRARRVQLRTNELQAGPHALSAELHGWAYFLKETQQCRAS